jgi:Icc-related predicted phosphoesterase
MRIAAMADVHIGPDSRGRLRPQLEHVDELADLLVIAGDLTKCGTPEEADVLVDELAGVTVPRVAVLGNHDYHGDAQDAIVAILEDAGITVLDGTAVVFEIDGRTLGLAGGKGFGSGFPGAMASEFGEPEMKAFVHHARTVAERVGSALAGLDTDVRVAVLHYSPVEDTLHGERLEIYPFLGSYLLAEAVDAAGADLVLHGHAHNGTEHGVTPGGVPVRNVAQPVLGAAYRVFELEPAGLSRAVR